MTVVARPLPVGNAVQLFLPPWGGVFRLLRRTDDAFSGPDDAAAFVAYAGEEQVVMDIAGLANGVTYYYRCYGWDETQWLDLGGVSAVPESIQQDASVDVLVLLRDRLSAAMDVEVREKRLKHSKGKIHCLNAPPRMDDVVLPVVTLQLSQDSPGEWVLGDEVPDDRTDGGWTEYQGWLSSVRVEVCGWSLNPDERNALRRAIKAAVIGNLPVFAAAGLQVVAFALQDSEDVQSFNAPVYQTLGTFSCMAPSFVSDEQGVIADVTLSIL